MQFYTLIITISFLLSPIYAFFDQFFQQHQQHQQQQLKKSHEDLYLNQDCNTYLCPDTLECVDKPINCPCPFPNSQFKCVLPPNPESESDDGSFVCISKGERDCQFVLDAYYGRV